MMCAVTEGSRSVKLREFCRAAGTRRHAAVLVDQLYGIEGDRCEPDAEKKALEAGGAVG